MGTEDKLGAEAGGDDAAQKRRLRMRSLAIALALGFLAIMFYAATIVRLGGNVANRAI